MTEKHVPEVGAVWKITRDIIYIGQTGREHDKEYLYVFWKTSEGVRGGGGIYTISYIKAKGEYLGKSKVSIEELFDVEEKENEKDKLATDLKQIVRDSAKQVREIIDNWNKGVV